MLQQIPSMLFRYVAFVLLTLPGVALAQVKLELKVPDDQKTTSLVKISTKQTLTIVNMAFDTGSEQEMTISTTTGKRGADGVIKQQQKIESLKAKLLLPMGVTLDYDSTKPEPPPAGTQFDVVLELIKVNAKATWTVVRGKDNRITSIEGRDKVLEGLDDTKRAMLQKQLDPAYLRDTANQELNKLPNKPVMKGDTWELSETLRLDQGQNMTFKTKYTYQGPVERNGRQVEHIDAQILEVAYGVDGDAANPLKFVSSELKPAVTEGAIYFDREKGMVTESRSSVQIKGTITFEVNGSTLPAQLDLTLTNSTVTQ